MIQATYPAEAPRLWTENNCLPSHHQLEHLQPSMLPPRKSIHTTWGTGQIPWAAMTGKGNNGRNKREGDAAGPATRITSKEVTRFPGHNQQLSPLSAEGCVQPTCLNRRPAGRTWSGKAGLSWGPPHQTRSHTETATGSVSEPFLHDCPSYWVYRVSQSIHSVKKQKKKKEKSFICQPACVLTITY